MTAKERKTKIREKWRLHQKRCVKAGRCVSCPKPATKGLRCDLHVAINRARCLVWIRKNPQQSVEQWNVKKALIKQGRCPRCKPHRKLDGNHRRCRVCRKLSEINRTRSRLGLSRPYRLGPDVVQKARRLVAAVAVGRGRKVSENIPQIV